MAEYFGIKNRHEEKKLIIHKDSYEIFNPSARFLHTMRIKGDIPYSKISGIIYYPVKGIQRILDQNLKNQE